MKNYQLICMSFDGEFQRERPTFETINDTWEYNNNLGSKWYFYPFRFVATEKTIISTPPELNFFNGKRIKTVQKKFRELFTLIESRGVDVGIDEYTFLLKN